MGVGRSKIDTGWRRVKLLRELAKGEHTQAWLADKYGVSESSMSRFARDNRIDIDEVKKQHEDKLSEMEGLWIAERWARIAEYQRQYDDAMDHADENGYDAGGSKAAQAALRAVAEELGQLKMNIDTRMQVNYKIEGVDLDKLT